VVSPSASAVFYIVFLPHEELPDLSDLSYFVCHRVWCTWERSVELLVFDNNRVSKGVDQIIIILEERRMNVALLDGGVTTRHVSMGGSSFPFVCLRSTRMRLLDWAGSSFRLEEGNQRERERGLIMSEPMGVFKKR